MKFSILCLIASLYFAAMANDKIKAVPLQQKEAQIFYFKANYGIILKYSQNIHEYPLFQRSTFTFDLCSLNSRKIPLDNALKLCDNKIPLHYKICKKTEGNLQHCQELTKDDLINIKGLIDDPEPQRRYLAKEVLLKKRSKLQIFDIFSSLQRKKISVKNFIKKYAIEMKTKQVFCSEYPLKEITYIDATRIVTRPYRNYLTVGKPIEKKEKEIKKKTKVNKPKPENKTKILNKGVINYFIFNATPNEKEKKFIQKIFENIGRKENDLSQAKNIISH